MSKDQWEGIVYCTQTDKIFLGERWNRNCTWGLFNIKGKQKCAIFTDYLDKYGYILLDKWRIGNE